MLNAERLMRGMKYANKLFLLFENCSWHYACSILHLKLKIQHNLRNGNK